MYIIKEDDENFIIDPREQAFHNVIREHVIFLILLIILYGSSYGIISSYKRRREEVCIHYIANKYKLSIKGLFIIKRSSVHYCIDRSIILN